MSTDRRTLNLIAAVLSGVAGFATLVSAMMSKPRDATTRIAVMSALLAIVGSTAWAASAYQDLAEAQLDDSPA